MAELIMQEESSTPSTPSSGKWKIYPKASGLYLLDDLGVEIGPMIPRDGWIPVYDSWTYASATTINVPTNATLLYQKGWGVRFKQGGAYKYGMLRTVAATLLTLVANTDYSVANAAITDIAVCPNHDHAIGFPESFNFSTSPTYAGGTTNPTSLTINTAKWYPASGLMGVVIKATLVKGSGNRTTTIFSLPFTPADVTTVDGMDTIQGAALANGVSYFDTSGDIRHGQTMTQDGIYYLSGACLWL
jgi:hypothetical protein